MDLFPATFLSILCASSVGMTLSLLILIEKSHVLSRSQKQGWGYVLAPSFVILLIFLGLMLAAERFISSLFVILAGLVMGFILYALFDAADILPSSNPD